MTTSANTILEGLNPSQREAVEAIDGPLLIVAGPGSGKTRVITHRVAYLVRVCGISPYRVLAVTFTNKAAKEMVERLHRLVGTQVDRLSVGTFHSFCARLLRRDGKHIGLDSSYTIYDDEDQISLLKQAMEQVDVDPKRYPVRAIQGIISRSKSLLMDSSDLAKNYQGFFEEQASKVYRRYEELLTRNSAVDFDDLLLRTVQLLRDYPDVLRKYQRRFLHILIDEFQDTNVSQYMLAKLLAGEYRNLCVVGDADQSIYSWRHADLRNILSFQKDYPEAKTISIEENYRSTGTILKAAKQLISHNRMRIAKDLWTQKEAGHPVLVHEVYNEEEEAQFVMAEIGRLSDDDGFKPGDCAVMYRVNAQSRALEEACLRYGMKYRLVGGVKFYQRREVKDVIAYLRLINNPNDEISLKRVVNVPLRGLGQKSVSDLSRWAQAEGIALFAAMTKLTAGQGGNATTPHTLSPRTVTGLVGFARLLGDLAEVSKRLDVVKLIDAVLDRTGYRDYLFARDERADERWENIMELKNTAQEFRLMEPPDGLTSLLERLALVADVDNYQEAADSLTLITLHQAKGLEFPVVFLVGMEEGVLPHSRSMDSPAEIEEERRLCYVGMTRSKERLYMLWAFRRGLYGRGTGVSRFLHEIPGDLIASPVKVAQGQKSPWDMWAASVVTDTAPEPSPTSLKSGDKVRHNAFGDGMVVSCVPSGHDFEVTVAFTGGAGVKRLLLSYANLEITE